jgi:two-component system, OmpR family, response regulator ResD
MNNLTISILENQTLFKIIKEINLFSKYEIKFYEKLSLLIDNSFNSKEIIIFFLTEKNKKDYNELVKKNFPIIIINKSSLKIFQLNNYIEKINMPFRILDFNKKIISVLAKYEFSKSSIIKLKDYIIDKNERKIKKNNLELKLTEKEINFLILFSKNSKPLNRKFVLENVWNYASSSETHTVETHIHRLRKKILDRFNDKNFIKNNTEGYYI